MARIKVLTTFKSRGEIYNPGEVIDVADEDAARWLGAGWVADEAGNSNPPNTDPVTLDVQNVVSPASTETV